MDNDEGLWSDKINAFVDRAFETVSLSPSFYGEVAAYRYAIKLAMDESRKHGYDHGYYDGSTGTKQMTDKYGKIHTDGSRSGGQPLDDSIEAKALALVNQLAAIYTKRAFTVSEPHLSGYRILIGFDRSTDADAFFHSLPILTDFIPKPDPLVQAMEKMGWYIAPNGPTDAENFRAALDALGFEIREKGQ